MVVLKQIIEANRKRIEAMKKDKATIRGADEGPLCHPVVPTDSPKNPDKIPDKKCATSKPFSERTRPKYNGDEYLTGDTLMALAPYTSGCRSRVKGETYNSNPYFAVDKEWEAWWNQGFIDMGRLLKEAYTDGVEAGSKNIQADACPHKSPTYARAYWMAGHASKKMAS